MAGWKVEIHGKGIQRNQVVKLADAMKAKFGEKAQISIASADPPKTRAERLTAAFSLISNARSDIEQLKEEMEEWLSSIPENLLNGDKASKIEDTTNGLQEILNSIEELEGKDGDVSFPSMF